MATGSGENSCSFNMTNKKVQCCALCKNHKEISPKKGHQCQFRECPCLLCELTRKAQKFMRHQQRFWRHQKSKLKNYEKYPDLKIDEDLVDDNGQLKGQVCDKCRNHNHLTKKKNHNCPYIECECEFCSLTFKRRKVMKHQQRVRRSNITTKIALETSDAGDDIDQNPFEEEIMDYKKLSFILSSMNSMDKDQQTDCDETLSGRSSSYSEGDMNISERTQSPYDFRSRASPPPLIPMEISDDSEMLARFTSSDDEYNWKNIEPKEGSRLTTASYNKITSDYHSLYTQDNYYGRFQKANTPVSGVNTSVPSLTGLKISNAVSSSNNNSRYPSDRNQWPNSNSVQLTEDTLLSPALRSDGCRSQHLLNDRLTSSNSRMDQNNSYSTDQHFLHAQGEFSPVESTTTASNWKTYVQPPTVFQTVGRNSQFPNGLHSNRFNTSNHVKDKDAYDSNKASNYNEGFSPYSDH